MELKRQIYAWLLLSVFTPMMAIASLHIHEQEGGVDTTCSACVNHQAHAGHLTSGFGHMHDCILCQLLTTSFVAAASALLPVLVAIHHFTETTYTALLPFHCSNAQGSRAPPTE